MFLSHKIRLVQRGSCANSSSHDSDSSEDERATPTPAPVPTSDPTKGRDVEVVSGGYSSRLIYLGSRPISMITARPMLRGDIYEVELISTTSLIMT